MKSVLQKALAPYAYYFLRSGWTKQVSTSGCVDEARFQKGDACIRIWEDLRERLVNLTISANARRYLKVEYREPFVYDSAPDTEDLFFDLARLGQNGNNAEEEEILTYVRFLKRNCFIW